jgi:lipopolysaccharide/colanic/teichoic acid biosynthesis glycosyltransferase
MYKFFLKRVIEILLILIFLPIFIFIYVSVYLMVKINFGSPILFKQLRPGKNAKLFNIYKFRTMIIDYDSNGILKPDKSRLTRFGKFLRSTSLDELPSLWSVIRGDMSLVGPRPLLVEYLPFYSERQTKRHNVKPGITGWAQINGRNAISWEEKFEHDVWYVENYSLWLDIKILLLTLIKVLIREGISPNDQVIMPRFDTLMMERKASDEK